MNIEFGDTFTKSLDRLIWREGKIYKFYSLFRYDLPRFFKNVWMFRKALYNHHWFDHHGVLMFMEIGIQHISENIESNGIEISSSRIKKVEKMRRVIQLIKNYNEDNYIDQAESILGKMIEHDWELEPSPDNPGSYRLVDKETDEEKQHNSKVIKLSQEIERKEWDELFEILKGQDYSKFDDSVDFEEQFDGSGLRGWWD